MVVVVQPNETVRSATAAPPKIIMVVVAAAERDCAGVCNGGNARQ